MICQYRRIFVFLDEDQKPGREMFTYCFEFGGGQVIKYSFFCIHFYRLRLINLYVYLAKSNVGAKYFNILLLFICTF